MLKLYKEINNQLHYWETWDLKDGQGAIVHWGIVGEKGQHKTLLAATTPDLKDEVQKEIDQLKGDDYAEIDIEDHYTLLIEYEIEGKGTAEDLAKRHRLEAKLDQTLGWTGLGHCDGGSIGSGSMEIFCYVVDFETAKMVIEADVKDTEFADYHRIIDENDE